jgi:hypothetical protein
VNAPRRREVTERALALVPRARAEVVAVAVPAPCVEAPRVEAPRAEVHDALVVAALPGRWLLVEVLARLGPLDESGLVVEAWRASPGLFGLPGHEWEHPDAGAVRVRLGGADGCVRHGWVRRCEDGRLEATATARRKLAAVLRSTRARCESGAVVVTGRRGAMVARRAA